MGEYFQFYVHIIPLITFPFFSSGHTLRGWFCVYRVCVYRVCVCRVCVCVVCVCVCVCSVYVCMCVCACVGGWRWMQRGKRGTLVD